MMEHKYLWLKAFKPRAAVLALMLVIWVAFPDLGWSGSKMQNRGARFQEAETYDQNMRQNHPGGFILPDRNWSYAPSDRMGSTLLLAKNYNKRYDRLSPEEKGKLKKRYQEWESLPEEKQQMLRRRMEKYEQLPPQERERFRQRYQQLKELPPDERHMIREKLRKWDRLPPQEQEQIRQKFRRP
ncbi:MAG: DUF3106 domain-containing protein [Desulfobacterales bacterium]